MIKKLYARVCSAVEENSFLVHNRALKRWKGLTTPFKRLYYDVRIIPNFVAVENIASCNRKCPYCPHSVAPRPADRMPESLYRKLIDDLGRLKYRGKIIFAPRSEPLLDERLAGFVIYARARLPKCHIIVQTNGDLLTPEKFEELRRAGIEHFDVSDHYRREGAGYVVDAPRQAMATYLRLDAASKKIVHFHDLNFKRIRRIESFHNRSGLISLEDVIPHERLYKKCVISEGCLTVAYNGRVVLCCKQWVDHPAYGNIENENIEAIWNKRAFKKIRKNLREGIFELELCQKCGYGYIPEAL